MFILRSTGLLLVAGLAAWISVVVFQGLGWRPAPEVLGLGSGFEGNLQLSAETIRAALESARQTMLEVNDWGSRLRLGGDIAGWLSFGATAAITLIAGFYGRATAPDGKASDTAALPARITHVIGFLAALAAVLTAFGSLAISRSESYFKRADALRDQIVQARAQVIDAKSSEAAQSVLDDLALKAGR